MDRVQEIVNSHEVRTTAFHCGYMVISYPLDYARTLIQIGYEPFPPTERTFFRTPYLALPNMFQYLKYIKSVDGFFGCYRGLAPRICQSIVSQTVYRRVIGKNPFQDEKDRRSAESRDHLKMSSTRSGALIRGSPENADIVSMAKSTGWEIVAVSVSTLASQPFYVIAVRTMAQFVGRETKYNTILESIKVIFREEGILGFFSGLVPRLVGDAIYISLSASLVYFLTNYLGKVGGVEGVTVMASNVVASSFTYQFQVVASTLAVNNAGLAVGHYPFTSNYKDWYECWRSLAETKQLKRGSSVIGRYYTGPTSRINGATRPSGFYFGPLHQAGLGFREIGAPIYPSPYIPKRLD